MTDEVSCDRPDISIARWMLHWPPLFAAMAAPYVLLDPGPASLVAAATGVMYLFWSSTLLVEIWSSLHKSGQKRGEQPVPLTASLWVGMVQISVPALALVALGAAFAGWDSWAYSISFETKLDTESWLVLAVLASIVLGPVLFLCLVSAFVREEGKRAACLFERMRKRGLGHFHRGWLGYTASCLAIICLLAPIDWVASLHKIETTRNNGRVVPTWDIAITYPAFPTALLTAAVMLSVLRFTSTRDVKSDDLLTRYYLDGDTVLPALDPRAKKILVFTIAAGWAATLYVSIYPLHLAKIARQSSIRGVVPFIETVQAVDALIAAQREAGRSNVEIAAELNRIGSWTPDAPGAGLATLVEVPERTFVDSCRLRLAADVTDTTAHGAFDWLPAEQADSDLKYCLAVTCTTALPWETPPALLLVSSHDSQAPNWSIRFSADVFADGVAYAPGGYCTADGRLAEEFQG